MNGMNNINIIDSTIQAVSLLNNLEDYFNSLDNELSNCDKERSDYEHLIENSKLEELNLELLYQKMQNSLKRRRKIKQDKSLAAYFINNAGKLNMKNNRELFIAGLKNTEKNLDSEYQNRILTPEIVQSLTTPEPAEKKKRGRPAKKKEGE